MALVQHDLDTKFTKSFDRKLKSMRVKIKHGAYRSPNTNAFVERFIQSIEQECLDRFVIFGEQHLDHVCREYLAHYLEERPHQSVENEPLIMRRKRGRPKTMRGDVEAEAIALMHVRCNQRLGGLLKSYHCCRAA